MHWNTFFVMYSLPSIKGAGIKLSCMFAQYSPNFQNVGTFSLSYNYTFIFFLIILFKFMLKSFNL